MSGCKTSDISTLYGYAYISRSTFYILQDDAVFGKDGRNWKTVKPYTVKI